MSSSRSSSSRPLPVGRIAGFRGVRGEMTVRVASGRADRWTAMRRVQLSADGEPPQDGAPEWEVESSRAYGGRLVLKLRGIDDPNAAERWKGSWIVAPEGEVPPLPEGEYWVERLIGLEVVDDRSGRLGTIEDVAETGGTDLLVVRDAEGSEVLVPLAREIVLEIRESEGRVRVALPEGFFEERS